MLKYIGNVFNAFLQRLCSLFQVICPVSAGIGLFYRVPVLVDLV